MHERLQHVLRKRYSCRILPEARLIISYPLIIVVSLIIIGLGVSLKALALHGSRRLRGRLMLRDHMMCTTAVNACLLDCYPGNSGEVGAWVSVGRILGTYIQLPWVQSIGPATVLGIQAAITFAASFVIIFLQLLWPAHQVRAGEEAACRTVTSLTFQLEIYLFQRLEKPYNSWGVPKPKYKSNDSHLTLSAKPIFFKETKELL